MKTYVWMGIIVAALIGLMIWSVKRAELNPPLQINIINPIDNVEGNPKAKILLIEYSDFQCPACRAYYGIVKELMAEFKDQVAFVYRYFPLNEVHANAELAAMAAQAAAKQGKFWEMHDLLFEKQDEWSKSADIEPFFESYAKLVGISVDQFKTDWRSKEIKDLVRAERANAIKLGLQGTPAFFLNGKQIQNPTSVEAFRALIKEAINKKE